MKTTVEELTPHIAAINALLQRDGMQLAVRTIRDPFSGHQHDKGPIFSIDLEPCQRVGCSCPSLTVIEPNPRINRKALAELLLDVWTNAANSNSQRRQLAVGYDPAADIERLITVTPQERQVKHESGCSGSHIIFADGERVCLDTEMRALRSQLDIDYTLSDFKVNAALSIAEQYGGTQENHHRAWVIDQMVRALTADGYEHWVDKMNVGGVYTPWDTGIAP